MLKKILILDDDPFTIEDLRDGLVAQGYEVTVVERMEQATAELKENEWLAFFLDYWLDTDQTGLEILPTLRRDFPNIPVVMITGHGEYDVAVEAVKRGAYHFLRKPVDLAQTFAILKNLEELVRLKTERDHLLERLRSGKTFLASASQQMRKVEEAARRIARSNLSVLILGESGTGKEILAQYIHDLSARADRPFVPVNCASVPEQLAESDFFGHEKGAFTGAVSSKRGIVEIADGGTLFLDEIGDMPLSLQAKVLRFLESREFMRVGGTETRYSDVRLIAATHQNLEHLIETKRFRQDLYYRINQVQLYVPPLRERKEDIVPLARYFIEQACREMGMPPKQLSSSAIARLLSYDFPGNVRELKNIIERSLILHDGDVLRAEDLLLEETSSPLDFEGETFKDAVESFKREFVAAVLKQFEGNQTQAARYLGISRSYLNVLMRQLGLRE